MKNITTKFFKPFSLVIVGIAIMGAAGSIYLTPSDTPQLTSHNSHQVTEVANINSDYIGTKDLTVYRSPTCGCCGGWIEHMQARGFQVKDIKTDELEAIKQQHNIPQSLASCHTTIADGYIIEGHIPADAVQHFLTEKPDVVGIAVPGMPLGTPGMEAGDIQEPFNVLTFNNQGQVTVFQEYQ